MGEIINERCLIPKDTGSIRYSNKILKRKNTRLINAHTSTHDMKRERRSHPCKTYLEVIFFTPSFVISVIVFEQQACVSYRLNYEIEKHL